MAVSHPIYINIYDLTEYNKYMIWFGIGIFHSGIEGRCGRNKSASWCCCVLFKACLVRDVGSIS